MTNYYPSYLKLKEYGRIEEITDKAYDMLKSCDICPHKCMVNRLKDEKGFCKTGKKAMVFSFMPHHGEEPPISGTNGSGAIFFSNCNMGCIYCQTYEFSQLGQGKEVDIEELAAIMLELEKRKCHNINLVSPTHVMPQILKSLCIAVDKGLKIPLVYNTGGYELPEIIKGLNGIIDIYLPDMRYSGNSFSIKYSAAPDYPKYNQASIIEMYKQVGLPVMKEDGTIKKGLIIRHLVMPNDVSGTEEILEFISRNISSEAYISLMSQYLPYFNARRSEEISRRLTASEYNHAKSILDKYGLHNGWIQESFGSERFAGVNIKRNI